VASALDFSRLAARLPTLDLFDPRPVAPFVRQGLRSALLAVGLVAISSLLIGVVVISDAAGLVALTLMVAIGTLALLLPVRGVHARLRAEKEVRLGRPRREIREAERGLLEPASTDAATRLSALLALETRLAAVREWPFDAPSLLRFALYLGLGLGSWVGAAAVEHLLDRMIE
jgi:hypothetical protein